MATVKQIYDFIDEIAPFSAAEEWDNSGILIGDESKQVNKILFALDITSEILNQSSKCSADLIITHHPVIFKPVSNVKSDSLVYKSVEKGLSIISAHTNYDIAVGGVNDILCQKIGFESFTKCSDIPLNIGVLKEDISVCAFSEILKKLLGGTVRYNESPNRIKRIAVCSGSGARYLKYAKKLSCDAFLTGDGDHHDFLDASEMDVSLICAGHFETENIAILPLLEKIRQKFNVDCVMANQTSPIKTI